MSTQNQIRDSQRHGSDSKGSRPIRQRLPTWEKTSNPRCSDLPIWMKEETVWTRPLVGREKEHAATKQFSPGNSDMFFSMYVACEIKITPSMVRAALSDFRWQHPTIAAALLLPSSHAAEGSLVYSSPLNQASLEAWLDEAIIRHPPCSGTDLAQRVGDLRGELGSAQNPMPATSLALQVHVVPAKRDQEPTGFIFQANHIANDGIGLLGAGHHFLRELAKFVPSPDELDCRTWGTGIGRLIGSGASFDPEISDADSVRDESSGRKAWGEEAARLARPVYMRSLGPTPTLCDKDMRDIEQRLRAGTEPTTLIFPRDGDSKTASTHFIKRRFSEATTRALAAFAKSAGMGTFSVLTAIHIIAFLRQFPQLDCLPAQISLGGIPYDLRRRLAGENKDNMQMSESLSSCWAVIKLASAVSELQLLLSIGRQLEDNIKAQSEHAERIGAWHEVFWKTILPYVPEVIRNPPPGFTLVSALGVVGVDETYAGGRLRVLDVGADVNVIPGFPPMVQVWIFRGKLNITTMFSEASYSELRMIDYSNQVAQLIEEHADSPSKL